MQKTVKTRSGRVLVLPTSEEDAAINAGIAADPDTYELGDDEIKALKPLGKRGRPAGQVNKVLLSVRYDADIVEVFRAAGPGWQSRMNWALRDWLKTHPRGI